MFALVIVAASVGLSNLAAAIGLGAGGVGPGTRIRVAVIFGVLEAGMPVLGLALGQRLAASLGHEAHWLAGGLLAAVGGYTVSAARRAVRKARAQQDAGPERAPPGRLHRVPGENSHPSARPPGLAALIVTGLALSLDNLVAGFALGSYHVGVLAGALVFGAVSVAESLAGLEFGARIGRRAGEHGELLGGAALIGVGVAIAFGAFG
jgi:manganese efflux pump family protein